MQKSTPLPALTRDKVLKWLDANGYPLEMRVASIFHAATFNVEQSIYYRSAHNEEPQEIDVLAQISREFQVDKKQVMLALTNIVECKSNPKTKRPWVVFTRAQATAQPKDVLAAHLLSGVILSALSNYKDIAALDDVDFWKPSDRIGYSIVSPPVNDWDKSNDDLAYLAMTKLAQAAHTFHRGSIASISDVLYMHVPMLAVQTELYECWLDADGSASLEERPYIPVLWRRPAVNDGTPTRPFYIYVVHESALSDFAQREVKLVDDLMHNYEDALAWALTVAQRSRTKAP
jgi:hypothetical protein